jgi:hypothetical protein
MLYAPGGALLGTLTVAVKVAELPAATEMGFAGASVHVAPASAVASHEALIAPAYEFSEFNRRFAATCCPGSAVRFCVPEIE